jgi:hypothetical protein
MIIYNVLEKTEAYLKEMSKSTKTNWSAGQDVNMAHPEHKPDVFLFYLFTVYLMTLPIAQII